MTLPYTEEESNAAHRDWKAMCGHHSISAASRRPLEAVRKSGIKLCGWMNPTMVSQCLAGMGVRSVLHRLPELKLPFQALMEPFYHPRRVIRVQFLGPWMKAPPAARYRHTHYVASIDHYIMDPILDTNVLLPFEHWIVWSASAYAEQIDECDGYTFTHSWNIES
ncbi:hypothetical protein [Prosthecobacter sp.]|uniref:hypothetical protein n=1 Tax=Prosthecobacter sp. TaxID=1965333 RepID=UPI003784439B